MGCTVSISNVDIFRRNKKVGRCIPEVVVYVPQMRLPLQCDIGTRLKGLIPTDLIDRFCSLRGQITLLVNKGSSATDLLGSLQDYLPVLIALTRNEQGVENLSEFKWKVHEAGSEEIYSGNSWLELLSVVHMMCVATLSDVNSSLMLMLQPDYVERVVPDDYTRKAVESLLKASGLLQFCINNIHHLSSEMKLRLPEDMQGGALSALCFQALGQGTELQLGLAVESSNATLSVKRRLACELVSYFTKAYECLLECEVNTDYMKKHLLFIKWKCLEAKASAYYYHGCVLDKGEESSSHLSAACCFLAAREFLDDSKEACRNFYILFPLSRFVPPWGAIKHLEKRILDANSRKSQLYGHLLQEYRNPPDLPSFTLSLNPEEYELPKMDPDFNL